MTYHVKELPASYGSDWLVEAINDDGEGEVYPAIFYGLDAKSRAEEYAGFKNQARGKAEPNSGQSTP